MTRRILAMLLSVMMILSFAPSIAFADDSDDAADGEPIIATTEEPAEEPAEEAEDPVLEPITDPLDDPFRETAETQEYTGETRTVTIGIVNTWTDQNAQVHYWADGIEAGEADTTATGETAYKSVGDAYWGGEPQLFTLYTASIPKDAQFKVHNGESWFGGDSGASDNYAFIFDYSGSDIAAYYQNADFEAKVGSVYYESFTAALTAAQAGDTVVLLDNVTVDAATNNRFPISKSMTIDGAGHTININNRGFGVGVGAVEKIDVTFKDVTIKNSSSGARCIDTRGDIGTLTLDHVTLNTQDASGYTQPLTVGGNQSDAATIIIRNNSLIQTNNDGTAYYAIITFNPVNMTIDHSTVKGWACIYAKPDNSSAGSAGSVFTIKDSTLVSKNIYSGTSNAFGMLTSEDDDVTFNITNTAIDLIAASDQKQAIILASEGLTGVTANLGEANNVTLTGENAVFEVNSGKAVVTGGTFNEDPTDVLADGYTATDNGDGTWTVTEMPKVAKIGNVGYPTLQAAIDAAYEMTGDVTVTLLKDITENVTIQQKKNLNIAIDGDNHTVKGQFLLDGGGFYGDDTISITNCNFKYEGATMAPGADAFVYVLTQGALGRLSDTHNVTVKDSTFDGDGSNQSFVAVKAGSGTQNKNFVLENLTAKNVHSLAQFTAVNGITITGCKATENVHNGININGDSGTVTITNNEITADGYVLRLQNASATNKTIATLSGNTFIDSEEDTDGVIILKTGTLYVESGEFAGKINKSGGKLEISGGLFTEKPDPAYCAEGLYPIASDNADYPYTVGNAIATVNGLGYTTFAAAVTAANGEKTIKLLADIAEAYTLTVGETLKVEHNEKTLTVNAPLGSVLKTSEADGVTTYTVAAAVAKIGDTLYASLADAVAAVPADGTETTIVMIADEAIEVSGTGVTIPAGKNVVLDLNGKTITGASDEESAALLITNKGTLTINDSGENGKIEFKPTNCWVYSEANPGGYASNLLRNEGTLVVNGGTLYNEGQGSAAYAIDNYSAGKVTINGGTVDAAKASAIRMFYCNGGSITVNGGTIGHYNSDDDCCYMGIQVMAGTNAVVNVSGGTIAGMYALYSNGTGSSAVNITDGVFDGYVGFASAGPDNIAISGGKFNSWTGTWGSQTGFITGGLFADAPDPAYCAEGLYPIANTDPETKEAYPYTVGAAIAAVNGLGYTTFAAAAAARETNDDVITLLADADAAYTMTEKETLKVKLDGHTLTVNAPAHYSVETAEADGVTTYTLLGEQCVVMYVDGMGNTLKTEIVRYGDQTPTYTPDPLPTREGYTLDSSNLWIPAVTETVTGNVSYALNWVKQHKVTIDADNGTAAVEIYVNDGETVAQPANPEKEGYTFLGWFDGNNEVDFATKHIYEDITIKAHWKINQYTVTFMDGETVLQKTTADYGTAITAPEVPAREGWIFKGWDVTVPATIPAGNLTINAVWAEAVAKIGDVLYDSVAAAIDASVTGDTIEVFAGTHDIPATAVIPAGVTLKGAGNNQTTLKITTTNGDGLKLTNANITISDMTIDGSNITSGGYKSLVNVEADGCVIDNIVMTGGGQSTWNSSILVEQLTAEQTFTVRNSTIGGSFRGVLRESCNANIVIENCEIGNTVYPFNIDGGNGGEVKVTGSKLHGWTSYSGVDKVTFTNCELTKGSYDVVAAYVDTDFVGCTFDADLKIYAQTSGFTFTLKDCYKADTLVTAANFKELFPADSDVWNKCTTIALCAIVNGTEYYSNVPKDEEGSVTDMTEAVNAAYTLNQFEGSYTFYCDPNPVLETVEPYIGKYAAYQDETTKTWIVYKLVTGVNVAPEELVFTKGDTETKTLTATIVPEDARNTELVWSSSDETVATVDENGVVTPVGQGTATITVALKAQPDMKAEATVKVCVAKIGDKLYASVEEAFAAAVDGDTIEMIADAEIKNSIAFADKKVTFDLNGKNVTSSADDTFHVLAGGELVFMDSVGTGSMTTHNNTALNNEGTLTVERGAIKTMDGHGGPTIYNAGTLTVNDGSITAEGNYLNALNADGEGSKTVINGGTITMTGNDGAAVIATGNATIEIKGGTIVADGNETAALQIGFSDSGNINVTGGTVKAQGDGQVALVMVYGDGKVSASGEARFDNVSTNEESGLFMQLSGNGTLEVTGGYFIDDPTDYVDLSKYLVIKMTLEDGREWYTIDSAVAVVKEIGYPSVADAKAARDTIDDVITLLKNADYAFVAGDVLKIYKANDTIEFTYTVPETYVLTISDPDDNGVVTYTVVGSVAKIEREGETLYFASLADAVAAAVEGDTVEMIADSNETQRVRVNAPITIELNGKVVTNNSDTLMNASADLTIQDSSAEGTGALRSNASDGRAIQVIGGTTTLKSGELYGKQIGVLVSGANFVLDGGKVTGGDGLYVITGSITVNGGEVNVTGSALVGLNDSTVTVNGGTIHGNNTGLYLAGTAKGEINGGEISGLYGIGLYDTAEVVMNDGAVKATGYCVSANFHYDKGFTFTMKGGQLLQTDKDQPAIYMPGIGTVNIEGGYIEGKYAVKMMHGVLNISGGTLVGLSENAVEINSVCYGRNDPWSASSYPNDPVNGEQTPQVSITGGYFTGGEGYDAIEVNQGSRTYGGVEYVGGIVEHFISDGHYSTEPAAKYIVPDKAAYQAEEDGTIWWVIGDAVASIDREGETLYYISLAAAIAAVQDDETIKLLKDVTEDTLVDGGKNFTLDLNEKTLTGAIDQYDANITITNGTVKGTIYSNGLAAGKRGSLAIAANAVIESDYAIILWQANDKTGNGQTININGTVNGIVWVMGNIVSGDSMINVNSGAKIKGDDVGLALNGYATVNVYDGASIEGTATGIEVRAGKLNVEGGKITGHGAFSYEANGNGTTTSGAAIAVAQHTTKLDVEVSITGGNLVADTDNGGKLIAVTDAQENGLEKVKVEAKDTFVVGTETKLPDGFAWGKKANTTDMYEIVTAVAKINDQYYATLADAVAAAEANDTIEMIADSNETSAIVIDDGKSITVDLAGHSVTGRYIDLYSGFLTITDTAETKGSFGNLVYVNVGADESKAAGEYNSFTLAEGAVMNNNVYVYQNNTAKGYGSKVTVSGTMNGLIFVLGNIHEGNSVVDVYGTINSPDDVGIALNGYAIVNVYEGASIEAKDETGNGTGIEVRAGELNVTGGTIKGNGEPTEVNPNGSGTTSTGAGIAISQHSTKLPIKVNISGGEISGYTALYESNPQNNSEEDLAKIEVSITGGDFIAKDNGTVAVYSEDLTAFISDGRYSTEPDPTYIVPSKAAYKEGEWWLIGDAVAQIGTIGYATLEAAFAAAVDGDTIVVLRDSAGNGIKVPEGKFTTGLTVDFAGFTYDFSGKGVGSTGTEYNGFQLLKDNTITFRNGTIKATSEDAGFLIQNYSNLTLDGMTIDGTGVWGGYVLSNNNGNVVIKDTTITAKDGDFAFDVCRYASYPSVSVTVTGNSTINGNIEIYASGKDAKDGLGLMLESGTFSGEIKLDPSGADVIETNPEKAFVKKTNANVEDDAIGIPDGYMWRDNNDGTSTLVPAVVVTFVTETGIEAPAAQTIEKGTTAEKPADPVKDHYIFLGWFAEGADEAFDFNTAITESITLTAEFEGEPITILYVNEDGTILQKFVVHYNDTVDAYTFTAFDDIVVPTGYKYYDDERMWTEAVKSPATEDAVYVLNLVEGLTVTFNPDNGEDTWQEDVDAKDKVARPAPDPVKEGYFFMGWYNGNNAYDFNTPVTASITLTAKWEAYEYEITYVWADDNSMVTATAHCTNAADYDVTVPDVIETVNTTNALTKDPTGDENGEITYTAEFTNELFETQTKIVKTAKLPKAQVEEIEPKENVKLYTMPGMNETTNVVDKVEAEYLFTALPADADTLETYGSWNCDYRITFDSRITKETFGLYGAYGDYSVAFLYPTDLAQDQSVYLLSSIGQLTYNEVYNYVSPFDCGVFNLSEDNIGKTITVELVIWQGEDKANAIVLTTTSYTFGKVAHVLCVHDWNEPTYTWADDNSTVTATRVCKYDDTHIETETVETTAVTTAATCEENGQTVYTAAFENTAFETQTKTVVLEATDHDWAFVDFTWTETSDGYTAVANYVCNNDNTHKKTVDAAVASEKTEATCEAAGQIVYTATEDDHTDTKTVEIEAIGHDWAFVDFTWTETADGYTAVANYKCNNDANHTKTVDATVVKTEQAAALGVDGAIIYTATVTAESSADGAEHIDTKTIVIPALPQAEVKDVTPVKEDVVLYSRETLEPTGDVVDQLEAEFAFTALEVSDATYDYYKNWNCDYRVTFNADFAAESFGMYGEYSGWGKDFEVGFLYPNAVHMGDSIYLLNSVQPGLVQYKDVYDVIKTFYCGVFNLSEQNIGKSITVDLVIWQGDNTDDAIVITSTTYTFKGLSHIWEFVDFTWTETADGYTAVANYKCKADERHTETVDATVTCVTTDATCEEAGKTVYTATVAEADSLDYAEHTDTKEVAIEAIGHDWGEVTYKWADDNSTVTATRVCKNDATHKETETVNVTSEVTKQATATEQGEITYTATFENEAFETQTKVVAIPSLPLAKVEETTPAKEDVALYTMPGMTPTGETLDKLGAEYLFTALEVEQDTYDYYKNWHCDYRIRFNDDINADTFGLYGAYTGFGNTYEIGFRYPANLAENESVYLLQSAGLDNVTYADIYDIIKTFDCGVFNLDNENVGKKITVELVIWEGDDADNAIVLTSTTYKFKELSHIWKFVDFTWTETADGYTAVANYVCTYDATHTTTLDANVTSVTTDATCEEAGKTVYTAKVTADNSLDYAEHSDTKEVAIDALGHDWGEVTYEWADDNSTVTATRVCKNNATHKETETVNTTSEVTKPATCEAKGETTYTATFTNEAFETQTKTLENVDALGHDWGEPTYEWAADNSTVTATRVCKNDESHVETETVNTTENVITAATCEEKGESTYTATFENEAFEPQTKTVATDAIGHAYGEPTYTWSDDNKTCTGEMVCANDASHKITNAVTATFGTVKAATCEEAGEGMYVAIFMDPFSTQVMPAVIPATGHDWAFVDFTWTETADGYTAVANYVCNNDDTHTKTVDATVTSEKTDATCEAAGQIVYTATEGDHTDTKTVEIEAIGHDWEFVDFTWTETADGYTAVANYKCKYDETHTTTQEATVTKTGDSNYTTYTATVTADVSPDGLEHTEDKKIALEPAFMTQALVLEGQIGVYFFVRLPQVDGYEYEGVDFTIDNVDGADATVPFAADMPTNSKGYYRFTYYVRSIEMADTITATLKYKLNGEAKTLEKTYTVKEYFEAFDNNVGLFTQDQQNMTKATADYGHYVQAFLETQRTWTIGTDYTEMDKYYTHYTAEDISAAQTGLAAYAIDRVIGSNVQKITYTLVLDSETELRVYLKPAADYTGTFTFTVNGETVTEDGEKISVKLQPDGRYLLSIKNIAAHQLSRVYTIKAVGDGIESSMSVSALSYVNAIMSAYASNELAVNAAVAIYRYAMFAKVLRPGD